MGVQAKMTLTNNILVLGVFLTLAARSSWGISGIVESIIGDAETADIKIGLSGSIQERTTTAAPTTPTTTAAPTTTTEDSEERRQREREQSREDECKVRPKDCVRSPVDCFANPQDELCDLVYGSYSY